MKATSIDRNVWKSRKHRDKRILILYSMDTTRNYYLRIPKWPVFNCSSLSLERFFKTHRLAFYFAAKCPNCCWYTAEVNKGLRVCACVFAREMERGREGEREKKNRRRRRRSSINTSGGISLHTEAQQQQTVGGGSKIYIQIEKPKMCSKARFTRLTHV